MESTIDRKVVAATASTGRNGKKGPNRLDLGLSTDPPISGRFPPEAHVLPSPRSYQTKPTSPNYKSFKINDL